MAPPGGFGPTGLALTDQDVNRGGGSGPGPAGRNGAQPLIPATGRLNGRALLGGFLVTLAAVGLFWAYSLSRSDPRASYVVAARLIAPGHRISAADLTTARMWLPGSLAGSEAFRSPAVLVGAVAVAPLRPGELVQASAVVASADAGYDQEVSFPLDPARALDGSLRPGETVAVLATYGSGQQAVTVVAIPWAHVLSVDSGPQSLGSRATENVTLGLGTGADALALTNAVDAGQVELVRVTQPAAGLGPYHAPGTALP